ncbi:hypothetical protein [Myceligenerans crystallogenes]|uniref:MT0933-like antitoxin protein n=1 Tax=Myceligenerans crystallogenes TaxID=316335 RepID=A0ABP4ZTI1_9MICO
MGLFDSAKDMANDPENQEKLKGLASEENVDKAAEKAKDIAPDQADGGIDDLADKAKDFGQQ